MIIFDNAPEGFLQKAFYNQLPENTDILVSSKDSKSWPRSIDLGLSEYSLTEEEGIEILEKWVPKSKFDKAEARKIIDRFNNLPVPIAQAGKYTRNSRALETLGQYLPAFEKRKSGILSAGKLVGVGDSSMDTATSLTMALDHLSPQTAHIMEVCAFLPAKNIPLALLATASSLSMHELDKALLELDTLLIPDQADGMPPTSKKGTISIHDLYQDLYQEIFAAKAGSSKANMLSKLASYAEKFSDFFNTSPKKAIEIYNQGLEDAQQSSNSSHFEQAGWLEKIAKCYVPLGNYKIAIEQYQKALFFRESLCEKDDSRVAKNLVEVGYCYWYLGKFREGLTNLERAVTILDNANENKSLGYARALCGLGRCYRTFMQLPKSEELLNRALSIQLEILGKDHIIPSQTKNDVGFTLIWQGKYKAALEAF